MTDQATVAGHGLWVKMLAWTLLATAPSLGPLCFAALSDPLRALPDMARAADPSECRRTSGPSALERAAAASPHLVALVSSIGHGTSSLEPKVAA